MPNDLADVKVLFPPEAQGLARSFRQPTWTTGMTLYDYLPLARAAVADPWMLRKQLIATLAARYSVLEYDAQDFTLILLFMKVGSPADVGGWLLARPGRVEEDAG